jgi:acyl carrier protein
MSSRTIEVAIEELISRIREELDDLNLEELAPTTAFREIDGWTSLHGLILMALVSTAYDVELSGQQVGRIKTVQDLYDVIRKTA